MLAGAAAAPAEPVTASNDALRTGWYPDEPKLDPATVAGGKFGQIFETPVQGQVYAQPLVADGTLLVVTETDRAYGLDPVTGAVKWERQMGEPFLASELTNNCGDLEPDVGITGTPVIDPETGIAYFYAKTSSGSPKTVNWQLHALRMASGEEAPGFPVTIVGKSENLATPVEFIARQELQRTGLLLMEGVVYAGFGSHCDDLPYQGWLVGVSTTTHRVRTMWATSPSGAGIWQGGAGLVSDRPGQILFATGNSFVEPAPPASPTPPEDLGDAVGRVQIGPAGAATAIDFFAPYNRQELDEHDRDLGSNGPTALPSRYFGTKAVPNLMLMGGKERKIFVLDRDHLGGQGQGFLDTNAVLDELVNEHPVFGSMAVWPGEGGYVFRPRDRRNGRSGNPRIQPRRRTAEIPPDRQDLRFAHLGVRIADRHLGRHDAGFGGRLGGALPWMALRGFDAGGLQSRARRRRTATLASTDRPRLEVRPPGRRRRPGLRRHHGRTGDRVRRPERTAAKRRRRRQSRRDQWRRFHSGPCGPTQSRSRHSDGHPVAVDQVGGSLSSSGRQTGDLPFHRRSRRQFRVPTSALPHRR